VILVLLSLLCIPAGLIYREAKQQRLNRDLIAAIERTDTQETIALLDQGADPNARDVPDARTVWQKLRDSFLRKRPQTIPGTQALVLALPISARDDFIHKRPFDKALIAALLDHGADVDTRAYAEDTPLLLATWDDDRDLVKIMLTHGANVNARNNNGDTALILAAPALVRPLLEKGADVDVQDIDGCTALISAAGFNDAAKVALLLKWHANVHLKQNTGFTALAWITDKSKVDAPNLHIIQMLKKAGANR